MNKNDSSGARKGPGTGGGSSGGGRDRGSDAGKGREIPRGTDEHADPAEGSAGEERPPAAGGPPRRT